MITESRRQLQLLLACYSLVYLAIAALLSWRAIQIVTSRGTQFENGDLIVFGMSYALLFNLLVTLPLLMVVGYRGLQGPMMMDKVRTSLTYCGLPMQRVEARMREYEERNSVHAFLLPIAVNLCFLVILWGAVLFPHGVGGILDRLTTGGQLDVSLDRVLQRVAAEAMVENWVFLGAYFYALTTMIRRWMQSDLTTNVLWKLNVRFAITVLIGLLLTALTQDLGGREAPAGWVLTVAFMSGLIPDVFLRWMAQQSKQLVGGGKVDIGLFSPSNLQRKITGMSFWQADRLAEEGIESVQDLAMKDITDLIIRTRFDPALLFSWVDRALLWNQAGDQALWLERANIRGASQLTLLIDHHHRDPKNSQHSEQQQQQAFKDILGSLDDARERYQQQTVGQALEQQLAKDLLKIDQSAPVPLSATMLENVISGLRHGPNLRYVCNYWQRSAADMAAGSDDCTSSDSVQNASPANHSPRSTPPE